MIPLTPSPKTKSYARSCVAIVCITALLIATEKYVSACVIEATRCEVLFRAMHIDKADEFERLEPDLRNYFQIPPDKPRKP